MQAKLSTALMLSAIALTAPLPSRAAGATPPGPLVLKSVSVDLPQSDRSFPDGPNVEAINNNCLACHSAGMVLNQPALPPAAWQAEVTKMIGVYKAPVAPQDVPAIVAYLASTKGSQPAPPPQASQPAQPHP